MAPKSTGRNSNITRRAAMALIAGGGAIAISGTGAYTQSKAPRKFSAATADDEDALLGLNTVDVTFTNTDIKGILKLKNRTNSDLSLTDGDSGVKIVSGHDFLTLADYPDEIESGNDWDDAVIKAWAKKERENSNPIELEIKAKSDSTSVTVVDTVDIETDMSTSIPKGCPVTPSVTVSVDDSAQSTVTNPGSLDEDVDGNVLISNGNDLDLTNNNIVSIGGDIKGSSTGNIKLRNDKVGGDITSSSGKNVKLKHASAIDGYVKAGGSITVKGKQNSNTVVSEYIEAYKIDKIQDGIIGGDVRVTGGGGEIQRSKIGGDVTTSGGNDVSIKNSTVCGTVISDGNAKIKQGSKVKSVKTTTSGKNIKIKNRSEVTQNITLKGSGTVKIKNKSVVNGDITANNGTVKVKATVKGDVTADKVTIEGNGTIEGEITEK